MTPQRAAALRTPALLTTIGLFSEVDELRHGALVSIWAADSVTLLYAS